MTRTLLLTELRLHLRHHVVLATAAVTVLWVPVLWALPPGLRGPVLAWLLLLEIAALGMYVAPALVMLERVHGIGAAVRVTGVADALVVAVRVALLSGWAVVSAGVLVSLVGDRAWPVVLTGVVLASALFTLLAIAALGRAADLTAYVARVPLVTAPLVAPAILRALGVESPVLALSPVVGVVELLGGRWSVLHAGWAAAWIVGIGAFVVRRRPSQAGPPSVRRARWPVVKPHARVSALRSYAAVDLRRLYSDGLMVLVLLGVPAIALMLRLGSDWIDAQAWLPASVAVTFVLLLHVPLMAGTLAGLLFLDDRDSGVLPALTATRSSLVTLVWYRLASAVLVSGVLVVVAVVIAGAPVPPVHVLGAAAALAVVPAMLLGGLARDRVQGVALLKVTGLPLYAPIAWYWVEGAWGWAFVLVPTGWVVHAHRTGAFATASAAVVSAGAVAGLLAARMRRTVG